MSAWTLAVDALPSTESCAICCRFTRAIFAPCGNGGGRLGRGGRLRREAGPAGGCGRAPGQSPARRSEEHNTNSADGTTTLLITNIPFIDVERWEALILHQIWPDAYWCVTSIVIGLWPGTTVPAAS